MYATGMTMHIKCILRSYLNNIKKFVWVVTKFPTVGIGCCYINMPILWWSQNLLATLCFKIHLELLTSIF